MNTLALQHIMDSAYSFAAGDNCICVRLRAAKGDLKAAWIIYGSKYEMYVKHKKVRMELAFSGRDYDYFEYYFDLEDTRLAYIFYLYDGSEYRYFSEDGATESYDYTKAFYNFFQFPFVNKADVHREAEWMRSACFYQIFVDRFNSADKDKDRSYINMEWGGKPTPRNFAGGDLKGITAKLDHIKRIGCNALYLTPIFESPSNHKYDIIDYLKIDPNFGTEDDLRELVQKAHRKGIRVVLDAVFNHCSWKSPYFTDACRKGVKSKYFDWFMVHGDKIETDPANYEMFADVRPMPRFNNSNPKVQDFLIGVATHYIKEFDIDGWRLDVSDEISHDFWRKFRTAVRAVKEDAVIIGENWHDASTFLRGDQFDSIMNYAFTKASLDYFTSGRFDAVAMAERLNDVLVRNTDAVNEMMLNLIDSHDTLRFYTECGCDREALKAAVSLLYLFPGAPSLYYGTENCMEGGFDPDCRRCMDWNKAKSPETEDMRKLLKALSDIRTKYKPGFRGTSIYASKDGRVLCLKREGRDYSIRLYINRTEETGREGKIKVGPKTHRIFVNDMEI